MVGGGVEVEVVCNGSAMEGPAAHGLFDYQIPEVDCGLGQLQLNFSMMSNIFYSCYCIVFVLCISKILVHITKLSPAPSHQHSLGEYPGRIIALTIFSFILLV